MPNSRRESSSTDKPRSAPSASSSTEHASNPPTTSLHPHLSAPPSVPQQQQPAPPLAAPLQIKMPASILKGHQRSVSSSGPMPGPSSTKTPTSILKTHQRAASHGHIIGQISGGVEGSGGVTSGHSRTGSRTDFILPTPSGIGVGGGVSTHSLGSAGTPGKTTAHSRQASRSESIYTLRPTGAPSLWGRIQGRLLGRVPRPAIDEPIFRKVVPNHLVPPRTPKKLHPNRRVDNRIRTTKYTLLSFVPKNLLEQLHRVANIYFIVIVLLNWVPVINAFGKEIAMVPVLFVLGVTAIKDLFEDRRRHASDKRINNSTVRVYKSELERYTKVAWKDVLVGDLVHLSNNETVPADIVVLRTSDPNGLCYLDTCNLDGETNLKQRQVPLGFVEHQADFEPRKFKSWVEVDRPTTKIYRFHGSIIHPNGQRIPLVTENLLLRECVLKNTDFIEGIVVYAGHETKAMLNNGGPRYKRSNLERQMNVDIIWCVIILIVLCLVGAVGCKYWLSAYSSPAPFIEKVENPTQEGLIAFCTFIIILQVMIPLSLYVTIEMAKLMQVYHIHNDIELYDPTNNKRIECRALNISEELGQVQYIFSDKTGTLTENRMLFRRCTIGGLDYNHPAIESNGNSSTENNSTNPASNQRQRSIMLNPRLQEDLNGRGIQSQRIQEFLTLLAVCNTVVVNHAPHHDIMNTSGVIETPTFDASAVNNSLPPTSSGDRYTRLSECRSITPSPPPGSTLTLGISPALHTPDHSVLRPGGFNTHTLSPIPSSPESSPTTEGPSKKGLSRPRLLHVPSILSSKLRLSTGFLSSQPAANRTTPNASTPAGDVKPIFEAESPDELALIDAAYAYNCRLVRRTPQIAAVQVPHAGLLEYEILQIFPFDSSRKCMSIILRHPHSRQIILYSKGADSTIFKQLAHTDDPVEQQFIHQTQQLLNSYARQGLRVLVMAKRILSESTLAEWKAAHINAQLAHENRERQLRESYQRLETNLTLLGATGIEDRLQEGVPETISSLIAAGIVLWVLTGDKPETAINVAYSARLFSPQMELLRLAARTRDTAENAILFYLAEIERERRPDTNTVSGVNPVGVFARGGAQPSVLPTQAHRLIRPTKKRALVVDGKTLTFILDRRSNLQKPFLELTKFCSSVLCCRVTPLQKAYMVKVVKERLRMRTLAIGDGANDVSMIQTADVGIGISGQEGMQAVMASDFAISRFKYLERLLLVHGHWCYDRLSRMILYFFYKNAVFVFLIFWFQLYCGFSGSVMIDQMYLILYNLLFTSLPPLAIGVYDRNVPADLLLSQPQLYRLGRLGQIYKPHSFWLTMADSLYQSIVIFFCTEAAYHESDVGIWEFGTTITTACMFVMLGHVAIETRSWTILHVIAILVSFGAFYLFSIVYYSLCLDCFGLPSNNYWIMQRELTSPVHWLVILLSVFLALMPRFVARCIDHIFRPSDATAAVMEQRRAARRGEEFLVSWSRSTSTSSIFRTSELAAKGMFGSTAATAAGATNHHHLTLVG